jgi:hypothetical protein
MRAFAADLRATGELRTDLSDDDIADIVRFCDQTDSRCPLLTIWANISRRDRRSPPRIVR